MDRGLPDDDTVRAALALAIRAPSVHNTQPWRWRIGDRSVHLYADRSRELVATDPDQRELILSCGAALHHLRTAFAALGWSTIVHRLPNPAQPDHLAAVELVRHRPTSLDVEMSAAISHRHTDRRRYSTWPVPAGHLGLVAERAASLGVLVRQLTDGARDELGYAVRAAAARHAGDVDYQLELATWSGQHGTDDGVPARNIPFPHVGDEIPDRWFRGASLPDWATEEDGAELLALGTTSDDRMSQLRAGEALSAALLTATNVGLATCLLTEPLEIPELRRMVRMEVLDDWAFPQAIIRVGWAQTSAEPLHPTPRRALEDVLDPFGGD